MPDDPYKYFRIEARDIVDQLGQGALDLEKGKPDPDLIARLLRLAHTLKGAARVVKQPEIADQAHTVEDTLEPYRGKTTLMPPGAVDILLRLVDSISRRVAALTGAGETNEASPPRAEFEAIAPTLRFDHAEMDELLNGITEAHAQLGGLRKTAFEDARGTGNHRILDAVEQIDRELRLVRETAERMRLLPVSSLFTFLERTARDAARAQGKRVAFDGHGGALRVDAEVLISIQAALAQLVRNAVAHGIEVPEDRLSVGKPPEGKIRLDVVPLGGRIAFRCHDDGQGIDLEAIRRAAERKGLPLTATSNLDSEEWVRLLLKGGISTSHTVTEVSGRGIGLDVVREAAGRLGGEVSFRTEPGRGVTAEIIVPLSLSSMDALMVEASGTVAAIPLNAVRNTMRVTPDALTHTPSGPVIPFDGRTIGFRPLAPILSSKPFNAGATRPGPAVLVEGKNGWAAFGVDALKGISNVVLRPLPELTAASAFIAGVSLNADGNPQLVLDPDGLVDEAQRAPSSPVSDERRRLPLLVIDDSLTTRMLEQSILESAGYDVDVAVSGEDGLEKARRKKYGLFLVDIEMPGIDGFTFIERTRADSSLKDVPSILVTSRESSQDRRHGADVGARDYVVKSEFNQEKLLKRIRELAG